MMKLSISVTMIMNSLCALGILCKNALSDVKQTKDLLLQILFTAMCSITYQRLRVMGERRMSKKTGIVKWEKKSKMCTRVCQSVIWKLHKLKL